MTTSPEPASTARSRPVLRPHICAAAVGLLVVMSACSGAAENIANQQLEDQGVSVDLDDGSVSVQNADGTTTTAGAGIPDGFPDDFPIPDGADGFGSASNVGGFAQTLSFTVKDQSVDDLSAYYEEALPAAGYEIAQTAGGAGNVVYILADDAGQVAINPVNEAVGTQVAVSLSE